MMLSGLPLSSRKPLPLGMGYVTSDGLKPLNPSGFAVLGRFTDAVKVTVKLIKSIKSRVFKVKVNKSAQLCK